MHTLQFWKSWPTVYRILLAAISFVFAASLVIALYSFFQHPAPVYTWQQLQELQRQVLPVHKVTVGLFDFTVSTENYILFERWSPGPLQLNLQAVDLYLMLLAAGLVVLFALLTVLPRFWFFVGAGIAVFMISSFQLETLGIFGQVNKIPSIGVMALFLGIALYYQYFRAAASFVQRLLAFLVATLVVGYLIGWHSTEPQPLRYFAITTQAAATVLLIVFMLLVAHEIMAAFVSLVGRGTRNSKSLQHYLIISSIYLFNLWLAYWNKIGWVDWGYTIHPVLLLVASGILAVWGIRQRQPLYEQIISADPFGVYFLLALGSIVFGLVGYFYATSLDIALLSVNDLILYTHIGYGMMFVMYMASNFLSMLSANFPVYKVLYKPTVMPYFSYRMAGLIFTLAFIFYNSWMVPVNHFISGYYTSLGDLYHSEEEETLATAYYRRAYVYATYNQHASMMLSTLEEKRGNYQKQRNYLEGANSYHPTEFSLIPLANTYSSNKLEEILVLQEGRKKLPGNEVISNNLGLAYARLGVLDSAYNYFSLARKSHRTEASADMNLLGLMAKSASHINADSVYQFLDIEAPRVKSNAFAIANHQGKQMDKRVDPPKDSILNLFTASLLGNYITNHLIQTDTAFLSRCIALTRDPRNKDYVETILLPAAMVCYAQGQVNRAFQLLQEVILRGSNAGANNETLALWAMDQGKPDVALLHVQFALNQHSSKASFLQAVALAETGKLNEAIIAWDTLRSQKDSTVESMKRVLAAPASWFKSFSEKEKYSYLRYRISLEDSVQFKMCLAQLLDEDLKASAILDRSKKYFSVDELGPAIRIFKNLEGLRITNAQLFSDIKYFELRIMAANHQWNLLHEYIQKGILFGPYHQTERVYYEALQQAAAGDKTAALRNLLWVAHNNFYFDEGVVAAASFLQQNGGTEHEIYGLLAEALQVNPGSIRILKAYIPAARARGLEDYAASALETLRNNISPAGFKSYLSKNDLTALLHQ